MLAYIQVQVILALIATLYLMLEKQRLPLALIAITLVSVFVGYRDLSVGTDTARYYEIFNDILSIYDAIEIGNFGFEAQRVEIGFVILASLTKDIGASFQFFLTLLNIIAFLLIYRTFSHLSGRYAGLLFYIYLGTFSFFSLHFNIVRQGVAVAFCFYALYQLSKGHSLKFILLVLIAATFHSISVVLLPAVFVAYIQLNKWVIVLYAITFVFFTYIGALQFFVNLLTPYSASVWRVSNYMRKQHGELSLISFSFVLDAMLLMFCVYYRHYISTVSKYFEPFLKAYMLGMLMLVAFHDLRLMALRIFYIFSPVQVFLFYCASFKIKENYMKVIFLLFIGLIWFFKNLLVTAQFITEY